MQQQWQFQLTAAANVHCAILTVWKSLSESIALLGGNKDAAFKQALRSTIRQYACMCFTDIIKKIINIFEIPNTVKSI